MKRNYSSLWPYLLLIAAAVVFFRHVLFLPGYVIPWDLRGLHLPHAYLYAEALQNGHLPLWDPYTYCGRPALANIQAADLYPTMPLAAWLGLLFGRDTLLYWLECNVVLHVALAGCFAFLLCRALGLRAPAALLAGFTYELCGFFAAHAEHMGAVMSAAWLPFTWWCVVTRRHVLLAGAFAMVILAGLTPLAAVIIASALCLSLFMRRDVWRCIAAAAASLLLAAAQLAPTFELTHLSVAQFRNDWLKFGGGLPWQAFVSLFWPNFYHVFEPAQYKLAMDLSFTYLYAGALGLIFAALGFFRSRVFAAALVLGLLATLGDTTPIGRTALNLLPQTVRIGLHPEYAAPVFCLALAVLAGLGSDRYIRHTRLLWAIALVAAVDLIAVSSGRVMNAYPLANDPPLPLQTVERLRLLTRLNRPPSRIDTAGDRLEWSTLGPITHISTANGADVMALYRTMQARLAFCKGERWGSYYHIDNPNSPVVGLMNTRYILAGGTVHENPNLLPRFFLTPNTRVARNLDQAAQWLRAPDFTPSREAIVENGPALSGGALSGMPGGTVRVEEYGTQSLALRVETPTLQLLIVADSFYPGWRATIDGQAAPIYPTDVAFRGVLIPPGVHTVRMEFRPSTFWFAFYLSIATWLAWAFFLVTGKRDTLSP